MTTWTVRVTTVQPHYLAGRVDDEWFVDWWIADEFGIRYDHPERIPKYIKRRVERAVTAARKKPDQPDHTRTKGDTPWNSQT